MPEWQHVASSWHRNVRGANVGVRDNSHTTRPRPAANVTDLLAPRALSACDLLSRPHSNRYFDAYWVELKGFDRDTMLAKMPTHLQPNVKIGMSKLGTAKAKGKQGKTKRKIKETAL